MDRPVVGWRRILEIKMRHRRRDGARVLVRNQPVDALIDHAITRWHVGRRIAVVSGRGLHAERGKAARVAGLVEQARRMYLENWLRIIVDARYTPARLVPRHARPALQ